MAYFPNGSSGEIFQSQYCDKCLHKKDCAVWDAHLLHSYSECNNKESILHILIPMDEKGIYPEECRMFLPEVESA